jgi:hypothetical protein
MLIAAPVVASYSPTEPANCFAERDRFATKRVLPANAIPEIRSILVMKLGLDHGPVGMKDVEMWVLPRGLYNSLLLRGGDPRW